MRSWFDLNQLSRRKIRRWRYDDAIAAFQSREHFDTITVGPGERWDVNIDVDRPGLWAFHCHILPHVEGADGMFGMVNVLLVVPTKDDVNTIVAALTASG